MPRGAGAKTKRAEKREEERKQAHTTSHPNDKQAQQPKKTQPKTGRR